MKTTTMKKLFTAALLAFSVSAFAQTNLGESCGCPPVASRTTVLMSTLAVSGGANDGNLLANTVLTCNKTYILDKKIYVPSGLSLTINPGTVIKGRFFPNATDATALVVNVGGKIFASGTKECQIVFTAEADALDGNYAITNKGQWGGVLIAGKASNNLTLAANGPFQAGVGDGKLCVADGIGTFEGFASTNSRDQFGVTPASFDDNDNSGILKYVSIRHSGALLQVGGEINGLTLGSVGRGTTIDHIEIVSCADDGIEFFGGTVNIKYYTSLFGNDDMFDWDDGYRGNVQFVFGIKADNTASSPSIDADNGFEMDADDQKSNLLPRSHPVIYNATMIGNNKSTLTSDNSGIAAIEAKELTEGEIYNSVFANWRYGFNVIKALGSRTGTSEAYHNWATTGGNGSASLKVVCNTFMNVTNGFAIDKNAAGGTGSASDITQFLTTDKNQVVGSIAGFDNVFTINNNTNVVSHQYDAIPNPALSVTGCPTPPSDGFFSPAPYRGAFAPTGENWLSDWAYAAVLAITPGLQDCPTDINGDGVTNNVDFLQLLGKFNQSCQ